MQDQLAETPVSGVSSRPPANSHSRVAQPSHSGRVSRGPRFARFAAAMEAEAASQDQLLPRLQRRALLVATSTIPPPRGTRLLIADRVKSAPGIRWLGIGSWALFCAALFVSLLLRPDRVSIHLDEIHSRTLVSDVRPMADLMPTTTRLLRAHGQEEGASAAAATASDLNARPADPGTRAGLETDVPQTRLAARILERLPSLGRRLPRLADHDGIAFERSDDLRKDGLGSEPAVRSGPERMPVAEE
jgi:hypothetical protein